MSNAPKDDETKFNETLKRLLKTPPKPHDEVAEKPRVTLSRRRKKMGDEAED